MALLPILPTLPTEQLEPPSLSAHTLKVPSQNGDIMEGTLLHWMTLSCLLDHPLSILLQHPLFLVSLLLFTRHLLSAGCLERKDSLACLQLDRRVPIHSFFSCLNLTLFQSLSDSKVK